MSKSGTAPATAKAPGHGKTIGIHAGARRRIHVTSPGAASNRRAPNWRSASSGTEMCLSAVMTATRLILRFTGGHHLLGIHEQHTCFQLALTTFSTSLDLHFKRASP